MDRVIMLTWSTDDLPSHERFAYWREERGRHSFGARIDLDRDQRAAFEGHFKARSVGAATLAELRSSAYQVTRGEREIANAPADAFCIYNQRRGGGTLIAGAHEYPVVGGTLVAGHADRPYLNIPTPYPVNESRLIKVPFDRVAPLLGPRGDLALRPMRSKPGVVALFSAYLDAFVAEASALSGEAADVAVDTLVRLALLAWDTAEYRDPDTVAAIRRGRLEQARALIEQNIVDPALSPGSVAAALGIPVRQLHLAFETTGASFGHHVRHRRLHRAYRMLTGSPHLTITEIAYANGFESMATFFRGFRAEHGCTPGDVRHPCRG